MTKLVLVDGNAILHRAYHALPSMLTTRKGEPINAVYGFVSMLLRIITDLKPTHVAVCFDRKEPTFRHKIYKEYQSHRPPTDKELSSQFEKAYKVVNAFNIPTFSKPGYEADDIIGTIAKKAERRIGEVVIVTGDKDILQLVTDKTQVYLPVRGLSNAQLLGKDEVFVKLGVKPGQIVDYKALAGDPSDNYPGVYGIGPKTAEKLLGEYGTYKNIYNKINKVDIKIANKLREGKEGGDISYKLAKIDTNVPIKINFDNLSKWQIRNDNVLELFKGYGFKSLLRRVEEFNSSSETVESGHKKGLSRKELERIVTVVSKRLKSKNFAIRGTASLILQDIEMVADDIDVICDKKTALFINKIFKDELIDKVEYKASGKFKSYFGKLVINDVQVEIMGSWQIKLKSGNWSEEYNAKDSQIIKTKINGIEVTLTSLETELAMFAQMGRWNAYHKIKRQIESRNQQQLF